MLIRSYAAASSSSKNSLQSDLTIDVEDDITDPEDLYIIIDESGRSISSRSSRYDGLHFKTSNSYVFSGNYDGTDRLLKIKVCDDTDLCSGYTSKTLDNVFTNDVPVISNNISVKSHLDGFNSKYVEIDTSQLNVTDDLNDFEVTLCTKIGGAEVSTKHAGFIVNSGNATAKDVLDLIEYIKKTVYDKFGVMLQEEVVTLGGK